MQSTRDLPSAATLHGVSINIIANSDEEELKSPNGGVRLGEHCKNATERVIAYLEQATDRERKKAVKEVIRLIKELINLGDYNIASAVNAGLAKFQKDVDALSASKEKEFINEFQKLMSPAVAKTRFHQHNDQPANVPFLPANSTLIVIPPVGVITGQQYASAQENFKGRKLEIAGGSHEGFPNQEAARQHALARFNENVAKIFSPVMQAYYSLKPQASSKLTYAQMTLLNDVDQRVQNAQRLGELEEDIKVCWNVMGQEDENAKAAHAHIFFERMADYINLSLDSNKRSVLQDLALKLVDSPVLLELLELNRELRNQRMSERGMQSFSASEIKCVEYIDKLQKMLDNIIKSYETANLSNNPQKKKDEVVSTYVNKICQLRNELGNLRDALHAEQLKHGYSSHHSASIASSQSSSISGSLTNSGIFSSRGRGSSLLSRKTKHERDPASRRASNISDSQSAAVTPRSSSSYIDSDISQESNRSSRVELIESSANATNPEEREIRGLISGIRTANNLATSGNAIVPIPDIIEYIDKAENMQNVNYETRRELLNTIMKYIDLWFKAENKKLLANYPEATALHGESKQAVEYERLKFDLLEQQKTLKTKALSVYNQLSAPRAAIESPPVTRGGWKSAERSAHDLPTATPLMKLSKQRTVNLNQEPKAATEKQATTTQQLSLTSDEFRNKFDAKMQQAKQESDPPSRERLYQGIVDFIHSVKGQDEQKNQLFAELAVARMNVLTPAHVSTHRRKGQGFK